MSVGFEFESASAVDPLIGSDVDGRYTIERVHGRGGMSVVYAGTHRELQRAVAIKVLDGTWAEAPEAVDLFLLEARTASSLSHPNIVAVSDLGSLPDGRPYLVMPMIIGNDLATMLLQDGPQPPRRVASLLKGVASALDLIHAKGLVHRDIKSENLMHVVSENRAESVLVLDFGIASARRPRARDDQHGWCGTPEFMPPEALLGEQADHRGDVYALATVAFELITGSLPFECEDLSELLQRKTSEWPRKLTDVSGGAYPGVLEAVIARGLAPSADARYESASELIGDLGLAASKMPEAAAVVPKRPVSQPPQRFARGRTLVGTGAAVELARSVPTLATAVSAAASSSEPLSAVALASAIASAKAATVRLPKRAPAMQPHELSAALRARLAVKPKPSVASILLPAPAPLGQVAEPALPQALPLVIVAPDAAIPTPTPLASTAPSIRTQLASAPPPAPEPALAVEPEASSQLPAQLWPMEEDSTRPPPARDIESIDTYESRLPRRLVAPRWLVYASSPVLIALVLVLWARGHATAPAHSSTPIASPSAHSEPPSAVVAVRETPSVVAPQMQAPAAVEVARVETKPEAALGAPERASEQGVAAATESIAAPSATPEVTPHKVVREREPAAKSRSASPKLAPTAPPARSLTSARPSKPTPKAEPKAEPKPASAASAEALTGEATDAMLRGDTRAAANRYDQALKADASYAPAWRGKGLLLERAGRTREAAAAFHEFLRLRPSGAASDAIRRHIEALAR